MHLVLTGATGHVGSGMLAYLLSIPAGPIDRLTIITRREIPLISKSRRHPHFKVSVVHHEDFLDYPESLLESLRPLDAVIWALGISEHEVEDEDEYVNITKDFPLVAAKAFSTMSSSLNFVYISAEGTSTHPGPLTPLFSRVKGQVEMALLKMSSLPNFNAYSVRLGFIDHTENPEALEHATKTRERLWLKVIDNILTPSVATLWQNMLTPTAETAKVVIDLALGDGRPLLGDGIIGHGRTVRNFGMRRLASLPYNP